MILSVIGMQWGDEGKGKFVDYLSKNADWVIRYGGGANAGHTIIKDGKKYVFHLLPTGILNLNTQVLLGPAMVIDPEQLQRELLFLEENNISWKKRIFVSDRAHLVLPSYKKEDERIDKNRRNPLGTTKRGVGIAYSHRALRTGIRVIDVDDLASTEITDKDDLQFLEKYSDFLKEIRINHYSCIEDIEKTDMVLFEGAQGAMLDMDIGSYPYVTSGPTSLNGVFTCGLSPNAIDEVIGVVKMYASRVGEGPFFTEFTEAEHELQEYIQEKGNERGSTTGRLRRCGHLDLVALRFCAKLVGITSLAVSHSDVCDELNDIRVCIGYEYGNEIINYIPSALSIQKKLKPVYKVFPGWKKSTDTVSTWNELPKELITLFQFIEEFIEIPIKILSTGPDRKQTIERDLFLSDWIRNE